MFGYGGGEAELSQTSNKCSADKTTTEITFEDLLTCSEDFTAMPAAHREACDGTAEFFKATVDTQIVHATVTDLLAVLCEVWIA